VLGLNKARKLIDQVRGKFCSKIIELAICAANAFAEMELSRDRKKSKFMRMILGRSWKL
jgi:hypothetical protein